MSSDISIIRSGPDPAHPTPFQESVDRLEARVEELEKVANGVIWLDNNIHNYGSDGWRGYFKAVLRDARRVVA